MTVFVRRVAALALLLAALPAAAALRRLAAWGREWAAGRGPITARASRRVAVLAGRDGAILEALFRVALDRAHGPAGSPPRRPR